jgi:hypothetical protein
MLPSSQVFMRKYFRYRFNGNSVAQGGRRSKCVPGDMIG